MKLVAAISIFFFSSAVAQKDRISILLDSAGTTWFIDFDRTDQLVRRAEQIFAHEELPLEESSLIDLYNLRIQSCNAFSRLQLWKQYVHELDEFLARNRTSLRQKDRQWFSLRNKVAIAQYYVKINDFDKALKTLSRLQVEFKKIPSSKEVCDQLRAISNDIAAIHSKRGEYEASVNQLLASIPYWECAINNTSDYSLIYRNIASSYLNKGDYKQAQKYLRSSEYSIEQALKRDPLGKSRIALSLYETEASFYERVGKHDSALLAMQKAIPLLNLKNIDNSFKGRISLSLGKLYLVEGKLKASRSYFDQAEHFFANSIEGKSVNLSSVQLSRAELFDREKNLNEALACCTKAIDEITLPANRNDEENPLLRGIPFKKQLFKALQMKSHLLEKLSLVNNDRQLLLKSLHCHQLSIALLDSTANEFSLDRDKVILADETRDAFEGGIRVAFSLYHHSGEANYFDDCFSLIERGKGLILLENLRLVNNFGGANPEWLEKEKAIKSELFDSEQAIYKNEIRHTSSKETQSLRDRYADLKRDYASLMEDIKHHAPDYYKLRFDHHVIDPQKIQTELLGKGEALIEFFAGDSTLTTIALSAGQRYINQKKIAPGFLEELSSFRKLLTDPESNSEQLNIKSKEWYQLLLQEAIKNLGGSIHSLVIVPDGALGYIPFEALVTTDNQFVAEKYSVRYAHSATYLREQEFARAKKTSSFLAGFVSSESQGIRAGADASSNLVGAQKEVSSIAQLVSNQVTLFDPATKQDFLREAPKFHVLHLAMHSVVNEQNPMLSVMAFAHSNDSTESELTAIEIYNLQLNADLAVLSACNTGFGELHRGEGIMSFARAFSYAGVPSAVISLWEVPDKATSKIMVGFYKHLKEGNSKAEALQLAKAEFVEAYPAMAHPFYWSGFILSGSNEPLQFPVSNYWYWVSIAALITLIVFLLIRKKLVSK